MKKIFYIITLFALSVFFQSISLAQNGVSSKGKEFYVGFMPNLHQGNSGDSLFIFIGAETAANVVIEYTDRYGTQRTDNIYISDPNSMYTFRVSWEDYEIIGHYNNTGFGVSDQNETVAKNVFHISSDQDLTVYAHSEALTTSEAFVTLPVNALGKDYYVLTYNSDGYVSSARTPSQFLIIAAEDGTVVDISPSSETVNYNKQHQQITLNKGEAYLVQSYVSSSQQKNDLTGTLIKSNKNIAVFAGHQRAAIPVDRTSTSASRDCLIEQLPPIQAWEKNAFIVPFFQPNTIDPSTNAYYDIYRVLASNDSTKLFVNGSYAKTLNKGEYYQGNITSALSISADKPILTAQFKKTAQFSSGYNSDSDPLMLIIPPFEQFLSSYRFINIQANSKAYDYQYVNIVVADSLKDKVVLDGVTLSSASFIKIPNSNFSYLIKNTANGNKSGDGIHTISCPTPIGTFIYGFGYATSYGYTGGMSFVPLDLMAPDITKNINCFELTGDILENRIADRGIQIINAPQDSIKNVILNLGTYTPNDTMATFSARLIDKYNDGSFVIEAKDLDNPINHQKIAIPGFTLSASLDQSITTYTDTVASGATTCIKYKIYNYGSFTQKLDTVFFKSHNYYSFNTKFPIVIAPNSSYEIEFCVNADSMETIVDSLLISNICLDRFVATFAITFAKDIYKPELSSVIDDCNNNFDLTFTESHKIDMGIKSITVDSILNFQITNQNNSSSRIATISFKRLDPTKESYIKITCTDSSGKTNIFEKYIAGFTIKIMGIDSNMISRDLGSMDIGTLNATVCLYIIMVLKRLQSKHAALFNNTLYSMPPSQFPIIIPANTAKKLEVCFAPYYTQKAKFYDTLAIYYNCLTKYVQFEAAPIALTLEGKSECDMDIIVKSGKAVTKGYSFNAVYPQPIINSATINIDAYQDNYANGYLYDIYGRKIDVLFANIAIKKGNNDLQINVDKYKSGTYLIEIEVNNVKSQKIIQIFK